MTSTTEKFRRWLVVDRRLEILITATCAVVFLILGFLLQRAAPPAVLHWFIWLFVGSAFLLCTVLGLLIAPWARRTGEQQAAALALGNKPSLSFRLALYALMTFGALMLSSRLAQYALLHHESLRWVAIVCILFFAVIVVYVIVNEVTIRRNSRKLRM